MKKVATITLAIVCVGCSTAPQIIDITSEPSKAAVSIDNEFIGKTPISYKIEEPDLHDSLKMVVEKSGFEAEMKRLPKKISSELFPSRVHFVLEPTYTAGEMKRQTTTPQQMGGQQMQGPTIIIPGSNAAKSQTKEKMDKPVTPNAAAESQTKEKTDQPVTPNAAAESQTKEKTDQPVTTNAAAESQTKEKTDQPVTPNAKESNNKSK